MGKKRGKRSRKANTPEKQSVGLAHDLHQSADSVFTVFQIRNGYLLNPHTRLAVSSPSLVYCKDIQDLTDQILSTQAQLRLNLQPAKATF